MTRATTKNGVLEANQVPATDRTDTFFEMAQRKNEFLATLAHELRNPLAPIKNGLQLLAFMKLEPEAEIVRSMMVRQVDQIVHLVDDLMDVARISAGKVLLDKQVCVLSTIVQTAMEESSILISENGMTLEVIDDSVAACVCGDSSRLTQVVCNLLNNAAKYGKVGGNITLSLAAHGDYAVIQVRDNGIGIADNRLEDIFRMYSQIESAHELGSAGLGIGLALVKTLVELHGGFVEAESDGPNRGSTFTVRLPLAVGIRPGKADSNTVSSHSTRFFRVLVVDDLRAMRLVTQQLLRKLGHEVLTAENGKHALELLDSFRADVVFSDITMPVMGGHELARRIREQPDLDSVYLVALTGFGQSSDREAAFESGYDRHLTKPVDIQRLRELFDDLDTFKQASLARDKLVFGR